MPIVHLAIAEVFLRTYIKKAIHLIQGMTMLWEGRSQAVRSQGMSSVSPTNGLVILWFKAVYLWLVRFVAFNHSLYGIARSSGMVRSNVAA